MLGNYIRKLAKLSLKKKILKISDWPIVIPQRVLNIYEIAYFRKRCVPCFFLIFPRNFTELVKITVWTDISCQDQWLQDTFASIQQRLMSGTV